MASFIDRIRGAAKGAGEANGPENAPAKPGPLDTGKVIGSGGEGAVYEDRNDPGMVIKVLHPQHATPERAAKLQAMCHNPPQNAQALSWPNVVETESGGLRYRMPKASRGSGTAYRFISANERRQLPPRQQEYEYRTQLGVKIAEAFRWLHAIHVRIGDVNPSNILVSNDGTVMLIDCDSFQIPGPPGHQPYPCVVGSPEYTAPEIDDFQRQFRSQDSDNYALAVLLYQLLGNGSHPYQGIDASAERCGVQHQGAHQGTSLRSPTQGRALASYAGAGAELALHARTGAERLPAGLLTGRFSHRPSHRRRLGQHPGAEPQPGAGRRAAIGAAGAPGVGHAAGLAGGSAAGSGAPDRPGAWASLGARNAGSAEAPGPEAHFPSHGESLPEVQES